MLAAMAVGLHRLDAAEIAGPAADAQAAGVVVEEGRAAVGRDRLDDVAQRIVRAAADVAERVGAQVTLPTLSKRVETVMSSAAPGPIRSFGLVCRFSASYRLVFSWSLAASGVTSASSVARVAVAR